MRGGDPARRAFTAGHTGSCTRATMRSGPHARSGEPSHAMRARRHEGRLSNRCTPRRGSPTVAARRQTAPGEPNAQVARSTAAVSSPHQTTGTIAAQKPSPLAGKQSAGGRKHSGVAGWARARTADAALTDVLATAAERRAVAAERLALCAPRGRRSDEHAAAGAQPPVAPTATSTDCLTGGAASQRKLAACMETRERTGHADAPRKARPSRADCTSASSHVDTR